MIIDELSRSYRYEALGEPFKKAFEWLHKTDTSALEKGKYPIDGEAIFAIVNEYETVDPSNEKMEAHKAHIDVQYVAKGVEMVGHGFLKNQAPSKAYDPETDFMLFDDPPSFYTHFGQGMFAIFFPDDLHMPNLEAGSSCPVKKIVVKIKV